MVYHCFYIHCGEIITNATIVITENRDKIDALKEVLCRLDYSYEEVNNLDKFVEKAKLKTSEIQILNLD